MERELLIELGLEELPASWIPGLTQQLAEKLKTALADHGLPVTETIEVHATPRRLAACLSALTDRQDDRDELLMGPPVSAAFGADGQPTPAALGFARKNGVEFSELTQRETPKGRYLAYEKKIRGRATVDVLPQVLTQVLRTLPFPKLMRWDAALEDGKGELLFGRPIRWLLFLYGGRVVPFTIVRSPGAASVRVQDVVSGPNTYGHRVLASSGRAGRAIKVRGFDEYRKKLAEHSVFLSRIERRDRVVRDLDAQARKVGGRVMLHQSAQAEALLDEVPDLVEFPGVVAGAFAAEFLALPAEVLTTTLIHHQHYFPVVTTDGTDRLLPAFLAVTNTQGTQPKVIATNAERVVAARLRDARFFWDADRAVGLEARLARLETLTFHKALGSYRAKADRMAALAGWIAEVVLAQSADSAAHARRAAQLAKADLATDMVREFTELQGVMGGIYAREAGEPEAVWKAIYHHYLPIAVESTAAPSAAALGGGAVTWAAVALADKLDTIAGLFHAGERPTGSRDPFGLRRAAHGVLRILLDLQPLTGLTVNFPVFDLFQRALDQFTRTNAAPPAIRPEIDLWEFIWERSENVLVARGHRRQAVRATLWEHGVLLTSPLASVQAKLISLQSVAGTPEFLALARLFKRVRNIARELPDEEFARVDAAAAAQRLTEPAELALLAELDSRQTTIGRAVQAGAGYREAYQEAARCEPAVARFFTDVFVMAEDPAVRQARLWLMKRLERLILQLGDISEIVAAE